MEYVNMKAETDRVTADKSPSSLNDYLR